MTTNGPRTPRWSLLIFGSPGSATLPEAMSVHASANPSGLIAGDGPVLVVVSRPLKP